MGGRNLHPSDLIQAQRFGLFAVQGIDINAIVDLIDKGAHAAGRMLQHIRGGRVERLFAHPAEGAFQLVVHMGRVVAPDNHIAPANVDLIFQR